VNDEDRNKYYADSKAENKKQFRLVNQNPISMKKINKRQSTN
jgi:hypothetical protein